MGQEIGNGIDECIEEKKMSVASNVSMHCVVMETPIQLWNTKLNNNAN